MGRQKVWCGAVLGFVLCAGAASAKDLGDILVEKGLITRDDLRQAKEEEKQKAAAEESRRDMIAAKLPKWLEAISVFGDVRERWEGFYENNMTARNRERFRARVGVAANVSNEISATVRLATGDPNDPISTNQTFTNTFTRKPINLDQAYLTLKPGKSFNIEPGLFTLTAGKFGANAYRTSELVWDDDLSPEGATETLTLVEQKDGLLRGLKVNAFQWVVNEVSDGSDPWMGGAQVVGEAGFGTFANWTVSAADYNYQNLNQVARTLLSAWKGKAPYAANTSQNTSLANSNSVVFSAADANKNKEILGYKYGFNIIHVASELNSPDPFGLGVPAGVFGDLAYNSQAESRNVGFYAGVGIGKAGKDWYHNSLKNVGDWGASYTYAWVEKDAVLSLFSYSDLDYVQRAATQKGSTNVISHIIRFDYELLPNLQLTAKAHFINVMDRRISNASLTGNPSLVRTQVDAVVKF
jgi:hypothetical protein